MPKNRKRYKSYTVSFRVSEKLYFELLEHCEKNQVPLSEFVREALKEFLKKEKRK
jgi:Arc/MetJ-type ribon-helix-helix transcriptional regulator